jgi:NADH-quinone oxidoreductase subunit G
MPTIYIDNQPYTIPEGWNLLHACLSLGFDIPYFCWHPALHSVGACRMCAVKQFKDEKDTVGRIVMSCMTPAHDGVRISIDDPEVLGFRRMVIEWLMANHPHDCPVCDEGGECHLQDMTLLAGHVYRRHRFKKRTYRNQDLGPYIRHEMNRCIQCYRCVRFYRDYAGGRDFDVFGWHNRIYFGRHEDGRLENQFSGNLIEVCPTGVFTDKTFAAHYTRKWDLQAAPSICVHCGLGCNTLPGERYGVLRRIHNRFNPEVNGYFLCDRGRFGYKFVNHPDRFEQPLIRQTGGSFEILPGALAVERVASAIRSSHRVLGIGSPRASLESNFALRSLVKPENFYMGVSGAERDSTIRMITMLREGPIRGASLKDAALADAVFILGQDVCRTAPMLELALRQSVLNKPRNLAGELNIEFWNDAAVREAIQSQKGPLFIAAAGNSNLDDVATETYRACPDDIARLGFAVSHNLDGHAPAVANLSQEEAALAGRIAEQLAHAHRPLIVTGTCCDSGTIVEAAMAVAYNLHRINPNAQICFVVPHCNSMGLGLMGGNRLDEAVNTILNESPATVIILENDLYDHLGVDQADKLLLEADNVICLDYLPNRTTERAGMILPAATFAESSGTLVNNESRAQRFYKVFPPSADILESWRWLGEIRFEVSGKKERPWENLDAITRDLAATIAVLSPLARVSPPATFRMAGQKIPRQTHRQSGRTAVNAAASVHESRPPQDPDSPLAFSMEGYPNQPPAELITHYWAPHWNSVQSLNKYQTEVGGAIRHGQSGLRLIEPATGGANGPKNFG